MNDTRPHWTPYFLAIAWAVAERTDCRRTKAGAVLVDTFHRIVGSGYPGTSPGQPGCLAGACPRGLKSFAERPSLAAYDDCISTHAEANAILHSDRQLYTGGTIYVTRQPCHWCFKLIKGAGIRTALWSTGGGQFDFRDMRSWTGVSADA
jgi:dCMP deaminase